MKNYIKAAISLIIAIICSFIISKLIVDIFGYRVHHYYNNPNAKTNEFVNLIYGNFFWYFSFFGLASLFIDISTKNFNTKKFIAFLSVPFFFLLLIKAITVHTEESLATFCCYFGGFICGYTPQFFFDQKNLKINNDIN